MSKTLYNKFYEYGLNFIPSHYTDNEKSRIEKILQHFIKGNLKSFPEDDIKKAIEILATDNPIQNLDISIVPTNDIASSEARFNARFLAELMVSSRKIATAHFNLKKKSKKKSKIKKLSKKRKSRKRSKRSKRSKK